MIIVVEGANGVGKTTLVEALAKHYGYPVYKPFRRLGFEHWDDADGRRVMNGLDRFRVVANSIAEDIFMADFIGTFGVNAILDRGILSAIVYGNEDGPSALSLWGRLIGETKVLFVFLHGSFEIASSRSTRTGTSGHFGKVQSRIRRLVYAMSFPSISINVDEYEAEDRFLLSVGAIERARKE